ncbi:MAG TPA: glycosyltransferase [Myxococcaceae bacterium]|jgi:glycosyltransferase involved in cell wall biosynthesis
MERVSCPRLSDLPRLLLCSFDVIPSPSGSSRRLTEYLKALPDRFNVVVLSAKTPDHSHIEKYQGARLLRVPVGSGDLVSRIQAFERAVRRQLESEEYALVHFTDPFGGYALCELKADFGYRLIYEAQTFPSQELRYTHPQTEGDKRFLAKIRRQELFCLMNVDRVVTGSMTTQAYIQSLGASTDQIRLLRAPVDLAPYTPDVLGVPDGEPMRLIYLGSQAGWQGLPTLLRGFSLALEKGIEAKLTLVGAKHPDWQPHLEDLVKELGIQGHVEFQPPVVHDDLVKVLALADVGVIPMDDLDRNRLQGGPLAKVSEYLAAGRPVIAADLPVTRELIPESTALFYPPGDTRALAECIIELARDVSRRVALGRGARAFAEQELDAGLIRGKLLDLYDELLEGRALPVSAPEELPAPTMTGTPTNRLATLAPPEGRRSSRNKSAPPPAGEPGKPAAPAAGRKAARDELPLVVGQVLNDGVDPRLIKTEPDARPNEPPVVMGLPLREQKSASSTSDEEPPAPTPIVRPQPPVRRDDPPEPPTTIVASPMSARRDGGPQTPTPIARSPLEPEEAPSPTPIVQMKTLAQNRASEPSRTEPPGRRPSAAVPVVPPAPVSEPLPRRPAATSPVVPPAPVAEPLPRRPAAALPSAPPVLHPEPSPPKPPAPPVLHPEPSPPKPPAAAPSAVNPPAPAATPAPVSPASVSTAEPALPATPAPTPPPMVSARSKPGSEPPRAPPPIPTGRTPVTGTQTPPPLLKQQEPQRPSPTPPPLVTSEEEPEEISEEEAQEISSEEEAELDATPTPPHPSPRLEEAEEISEDEVQEAGDADEVESVDDQVEPVDEADEADADQIDEDEADPIEEVQPTETPRAAAPAAEPEDAPVLAPPDSALDPWFAQLAHGYCPPEGAQFARHAPPTTFPGRDEHTTDPSHAPQTPSLAHGASRGKPS